MVVYAKDLAIKIKKEVAKQVAYLRRPPVLSIILVGNDPASEIYVRNKTKDCLDCNIICKEYRLAAEVSTTAILDLIFQLNNDKTVDGILVQLPLPSHIDSDKVISSIKAGKDVDCFNSMNVGKLYLGREGLRPCTPSGVMAYLEENQIDLEGKNCVVIGRSNIVGKPVAAMLTEKNATVTLCHSKTKNLEFYTKNADVIVCAVGKAKFLTADMVKDGCVIVDVGINKNEDGKLCGDVDFEEVSKKASLISPVPGGIGLLTRACLMRNVAEAARIHQGTIR